ncbi:MAG: enoyl-CoA hydratase/isomerase family protein, partial [Cyanobacteria bacterium HKST-UBA06]|nr:enoyl-CoA hydratase/isomerase family protein [Cyanobacteria bacterium HKST-UBA06]
MPAAVTTPPTPVDFKTLEFLLVTVDTDRRIATVQLNRPDKLNAISIPLMGELVATLQTLEADASVGCIVLTGNQKAFAAGADIGQMATASAIDMYQLDQFAQWDKIRKIKTPIVAAVNGFCLGGGCELAMTCDMIVAGEGARFGQPEINIGIIPGAGGTQRLTRAVGKAMAMELVLTGRQFSGAEAKQM